MLRVKEYGENLKTIKQLKEQSELLGWANVVNHGKLKLNCYEIYKLKEPVELYIDDDFIINVYYMRVNQKTLLDYDFYTEKPSIEFLIY